MNSKNKTKLQLFFSGLVTRFIENERFFEGITIVLTSGTRKFEGTIFLDRKNVDDILTLKLNNILQVDNFEKLLDTLVEEAIKYDTFTLVYNERGTCVTIEANDKGVTSKSGESIKNEITKSDTNTSREYLLKAGKANKLLFEIGILTADGKLKNDMIRKYNQIDYFVEIVAQMLNNFPKDKEIKILDCACGKSYLSFALNYYMRDILKLKCSFIGIDISDQVITASRERARRLAYHNMEFSTADLNAYTPDFKPDLVISLHACDTATDLAIALALNSKALSLVIVPCCHSEMQNQIYLGEYNSLIDEGIFRRRMNDVITDSLRVKKIQSYGYKTTVMEYISPLETPKNLLIMGIREKGYNNKAKSDYALLLNKLQVSPLLDKIVR